MEENENKDEKVNIRHTITAEETFTLAKDVYDLRSFIVNVYSNRAIISRRLNILTLTFSAIFTILYSAYVLFTALYETLTVNLKIVLYALIGIYAVLFIVLLIVFLCRRSDTKHIQRTKMTLTVFKYLVRIFSMAISIFALVLSIMGGEFAAPNVAIDIIIIILSIIMLVVQITPLLFGGFGKLARWLLSPVKIKYRFSHVILEWYDLAVSGNVIKGSKNKVSSKYFEDIGTIIDNYLIPALGKKYINSIKPAAILAVVEKAEPTVKPIMEGVLKNVFAYAVECGYVIFDPCKDLNFEGSVEEEEKKQKATLKSKVIGVGKKLGINVLGKYLNKNSENNE